MYYNIRAKWLLLLYVRPDNNHINCSVYYRISLDTSCVPWFVNSSQRKYIFSFRVHSCHSCVPIILYDVHTFIILFHKEYLYLHKAGMKTNVCWKNCSGNGSLSRVHTHTHTQEMVLYIILCMKRRIRLVVVGRARKICIRKYCRQHNFSDCTIARGAIRAHKICTDWFTRFFAYIII